MKKTYVLSSLALMAVLAVSACSAPAATAPAKTTPATTTVPATTATTAATTTATTPAVDAAAVYAANCAGCHGDKRQGVQGVGPSLSAAALGSKTDAAVTDTIANGRTPASGVAMPAFKDKLTDAQISALVKFIKAP